MVDDIIVTMARGRRRVPREVGDDAVTRCGEPHVGSQSHCRGRDRFVETFPARFTIGREFGKEVGQGGPELFGNNGGLPLLFGLEAVDFGEGLQGFGAPTLDRKGI